MVPVGLRVPAVVAGRWVLVTSLALVELQTAGLVWRLAAPPVAVAGQISARLAGEVVVAAAFDRLAILLGPRLAAATAARNFAAAETETSPVGYS